ncbi:MAG: cytochrome c peroxidase [Pirellulaceae bacterium]
MRCNPITPLAFVIACCIATTSAPAIAQDQSDSIRVQTNRAKLNPAKLNPTKSERMVPVAIDVVHDHNLLLITCRNGTVQLVDLETKKVSEWLEVSGALSTGHFSTAKSAHGVLDTENNLLVKLNLVDGQLAQVGNIAVPASPVDFVWSADGERCLVVSSWARLLTAIDWRGNSAKTVASINLPFAPGKMLLLPDQQHVVVADKFGSGIALFDWHDLQLKRVGKINGHNISDMALNFDRTAILLTHQVLFSEKETTRPGVHWGEVLANVVESIKLETLLRGTGRLITIPGSVYYLGIPDAAAGDPAGLAETSNERRVVAYAGVNQVAVSDQGVNFYHRIDIGKRPTEIALSRNQEVAYVCNSFSDSISVVQIDPAKLLYTIQLNTGKLSLTAAERGEELFFDSKLAQDGWFSCHSCHTDGHTSNQLNDNLGDNSFGAPKRVPSLLGVAETSPWTWQGTADSLRDQIAKSVELTMRGEPMKRDQQDDIVAYLKTLKPAMSVREARLYGLKESELEYFGAQIPKIDSSTLFETSSCIDCHSPPNYTSKGVYDVGLKDELGNTEFNPPSLLGVSQRDKLFHDGRAGSLKEVLKKYRHGQNKEMQNRELTDDEIEEIVEFLMRL